MRAELADLAGARFEWKSPLAGERYAEYWDKAFLQRVGLDQYATDLAAFWPTGGPHWDALAVVAQSGKSGSGVLLVEGKSYPGELYGGGAGAKPGSSSRELIEKSLAWTQRQLGVPDATVDDWCGPLYQSANRLAHLCWLRPLGVRAWLVHLLFVDDPHSPTSAVAWELALQRVNQELGLPTTPVPGAAHVLLPAGTREELIGAED